MDPVGRTGVSVQGQLLAFDGRLWLAGGNVVSPAVYDMRSGNCLNDPAQHIRRTVNNNVPCVRKPARHASCIGSATSCWSAASRITLTRNIRSMMHR